MATNWNTRRSIAICTEKLEGRLEIIKMLIVERHFADDEALDTVLSKLAELKISHLNAAIAKCENGVFLLEETKAVLKMQKKRLEATQKVCLLKYYRYHCNVNVHCNENKSIITSSTTSLVCAF